VNRLSSRGWGEETAGRERRTPQPSHHSPSATSLLAGSFLAFPAAVTPFQIYRFTPFQALYKLVENHKIVSTKVETNLATVK